MEREDILDTPGFVSTKKAAELLGVSYYRVYEYIKAGRLPVKRVGHMLFVPVEAIEQFQAGASGRTRTQPPAWRVYRSGIKLLGTDIEVQVYTGQEKKAIEKLKAIYEHQQHTFTGSIARFVFEDEASPAILSIWLVWKDSELPDEATHQKEFEAFKAALADVLDWETAKIRHKKGIIYT